MSEPGSQASSNDQRTLIPQSTALNWLTHHAVVPPAASSAALRPTISNFTEANQPLTPNEIFQQLIHNTGGWPHRFGNCLYAEGSDNRTVWFDKENEFYVWLKAKVRLRWKRGSSAVTKGEFFAYLYQNAPSRNWVYECPHHPPMSNVDYIHPVISDGDGRCLDELLNMFVPETPIDRYLLRSLALTLFWGGIPGQRPAYLIAGPEIETDDSRNGRGSGKSIVVEALASLSGGLIACGLNEQMETIKTRLLSEAAAQKRIVLVDNVRTMRLTSADIEAAITAHTISGRKLYKGEAQRPNTIGLLTRIYG